MNLILFKYVFYTFFYDLLQQGAESYPSLCNMAQYLLAEQTDILIVVLEIESGRCFLWRHSTEIESHYIVQLHCNLL